LLLLDVLDHLVQRVARRRAAELATRVVAFHDQPAVPEESVELLLEPHAPHGVEQIGFGLAGESRSDGAILAPAPHLRGHKEEQERRSVEADAREATNIGITSD
jgi:hypothetical protein